MRSKGSSSTGQGRCRHCSLRRLRGNELDTDGNERRQRRRRRRGRRRPPFGREGTRLARAVSRLQRATNRACTRASRRSMTRASPHTRRPATPTRTTTAETGTRPSREAGRRRSALRRRHQRWRGTARPLHRRAACAARDRRGRHDLRARLRHVEERAAVRRRTDQRRHGPAVPCLARTASARVRPAIGAGVRAGPFASTTSCDGSKARGRRARRSFATSSRPRPRWTTSSSSAIATITRGIWHGAFPIRQSSCPRPNGIPPSRSRSSARVPRRARDHVQLAGRAGDDSGTRR